MMKLGEKGTMEALAITTTTLILILEPSLIIKTMWLDVKGKTSLILLLLRSLDNMTIIRILMMIMMLVQGMMSGDGIDPSQELLN